MNEDSKPLIFPSSVNDDTQEKKENISQWWDRFKKWAFLILAVVVGLFDVVADWQNFKNTFPSPKI